MNNVLKNGFYTTVGLLLSGLNSVNADIIVGPIMNGVEFGVGMSHDNTIQNFVSNFMIFLLIIAVLYLLWGGMNILSAAGDKKKIKKGKTVIIHAVIGFFIILIASPIIIWVFELFFGY